MLEQLMAAADIRAAETAPQVESQDDEEGQGQTEEGADQEGFGLSRR
jgi:hypothetical protein